MAPLPVFGKAHQASAGRDFTWFIYGSSLEPAAFGAWAEQHGYRVPDLGGGVPARLHGFRLAFDVVSRAWGGPVASLTESPGGWVEGIALPLPGSARGLADHKEGAVSGLYVALEVRVAPLAGGDPIEALAYRANPSRRLASEGPPAPSYLAAVISGARRAGLSPEWLAQLERLAGG